MDLEVHHLLVILHVEFFCVETRKSAGTRYALHRLFFRRTTPYPLVCKQKHLRYNDRILLAPSMTPAQHSFCGKAQSHTMPPVLAQ